MSIPPTQIEVRGELLQRFGYYPAGFKKPSPEKLAELHIEPEEAERKFKKINEKVIEVAKVYPEFMKSFGVPLIAILVIGIGLICFAIGFFLTIPTSVSAKPSKWDPQTQFQYDALVLLSEVLFILPITYLLVMFISTKQTISRANMELIYGVNFVLQKYLPESRSTGIYWSLEVRNIKRFYIFSRNQKNIVISNYQIASDIAIQKADPKEIFKKVAVKESAEMNDALDGLMGEDSPRESKAKKTKVDHIPSERTRV